MSRFRPSRRCGSRSARSTSRAGARPRAPQGIIGRAVRDRFRADHVRRAGLSLAARVPALLLVLWVWRFARRRADTRRLARARDAAGARALRARRRPAVLAVPDPRVGLLIVALARPHGPATASCARAASTSSSCRTARPRCASRTCPAIAGSASMRFLRVLGDSLSWKNDRIALALFAHIAAPQIRLTKDPNTFFFFLDHLDKAPPFRIEEDTTWDTNLELGIHWGLRLIERDEEMHGKSSNAKVFVVLSDGEIWSGEVEKRARRRATTRQFRSSSSASARSAAGACRRFRAETARIDSRSRSADDLAARSGGAAADRLRGRRPVLRARSRRRPAHRQRHHRRRQADGAVARRRARRPRSCTGVSSWRRPECRCRPAVPARPRRAVDSGGRRAATVLLVVSASCSSAITKPRTRRSRVFGCGLLIACKRPEGPHTTAGRTWPR